MPTKYRSKFESKVAKELKDAGVPFEYEAFSYEYDEPLRKNRASCSECGSKDLVRTGCYTPDFFLSSGIIIECKGRFTAADRRKMLAIEETHGLGIKMLFMRDNRIHKNSNTFYSDWCMENDMDFAIGSPKQEWLQ